MNNVKINISLSDFDVDYLLKKDYIEMFALFSSKFDVKESIFYLNRNSENFDNCRDRISFIQNFYLHNKSQCISVALREFCLDKLSYLHVHLLFRYRTIENDNFIYIPSIWFSKQLSSIQDKTGVLV